MVSSDLQLRRHVQDELEWEPSINPASIGVSVKDAVVTLSGEVETYAEKHAAAEVVAEIHGMRGVANELEVKLPADAERSDEDIAHTIASIFTWNTAIPSDHVRVEVAQGWVTLAGTVDWHFQRMAAEAAVRGLMGVNGISVRYRTVTYNMILIACNTGMRPAEMKNLRWRDIMPAKDREIVSCCSCRARASHAS